MHTLIDLSHPLHVGMLTHPALPGPSWEAHRTREDYRATTGTDFQIDRVTMVGNTGTYLESPFHRFADGVDLGSLSLAAAADLPIQVVDTRGTRAVGIELLEDQLGGAPIKGAAVLLRTGCDRDFGTPAYAEAAPYLTESGARWLSRHRPALIGIDAVNIDDLADITRPSHTVLLAHDVLVLEHLAHLDDLPRQGARLHAAPPAWHGIGTWPVRAYALVSE